MKILPDEKEYLKKLYYVPNEGVKIKGIEPFFKLTNAGSKALNELNIPKSRDEFRNFIWNLYIVFYEGSSRGKRIPSSADKENVISNINDYRNYYFHDIEHGKENKVRKKYEKIRKINVDFIGKEVLTLKEDWVRLGTKFVNKLSTILINLGKEEPPSESNGNYNEFFDDRITMFSNKPLKYRKIGKYGKIEHLSEAAIFLPTFYMTAPPEFGNTRSAIHITSEAFNGSFDSFRRFILEIKKLWLKDTFREVLQIDRIMPWSISDTGYMVYGSGVENLLEALKIYNFGVITMILQGCYGEDYSKSFFVIISSYRKGDLFRDNFIDFYLSNIPMNWEWINNINNSLDILSSMNRKATNYSLKTYYFYRWRGNSNISLKQVPGGHGKKRIW